MTLPLWAQVLYVVAFVLGCVVGGLRGKHDL